MYKKIITDYLKSKIQSLRTVIIFGSFANNSENRCSDIDIAFLSSKKISNILKMGIAGRISLNNCKNKKQENCLTLFNKKIYILIIQYYFIIYLYK